MTKQEFIMIVEHDACWASQMAAQTRAIAKKISGYDPGMAKLYEAHARTAEEIAVYAKLRLEGR